MQSVCIGSSEMPGMSSRQDFDVQVLSKCRSVSDEDEFRQRSSPTLLFSSCLRTDLLSTSSPRLCLLSSPLLSLPSSLSCVSHCEMWCVCVCVCVRVCA